MTSTPEEYARAFAATLPESYRRNFDWNAIATHARISRERGSDAANVGTFFTNRVPGAPICVIADDRPGLLATISAALVMCGLDVIEAEAYTRRINNRHDEAVDVFWVRHDDPNKRRMRLSKEEIDQLRETLIGLLDGKVLRAEPSTRPVPTPASSETVVRFIEGQDGVFSTLEVETGDRSGLLLALAQALFKQRVQIVSSQVRTNGTRVFDRFNIVELDGSPISQARRLEIQVAVISAVDPIQERAVAANAES